MNNLPKDKIEYKIGLFLMFFYILTSYVAVDIIIPSTYNTLFLYAFLGWGFLVTLLWGIKEKISTYTWYYVTFMLISLFSMGYSQEFQIFSGQFYLMIVSFLLTFVFQQFIRKDKDFVWMCWFYAISSLSLVIMLQATGNLVGGTDVERLGQELMGNANIFATVIMMAVLYELWLIVYVMKKWYAKLMLIAMVIYNMYALALSAGRKYVVIPFVFLYIMLMSKTNKKGKTNIILYTLLLVILVVGAYTLMMNNETLYESIGVRMEQLIEGQTDESKLDGSSKIREIMRNDAIEQWWEKPFFGYGFDSYKYRANEVVKHFYYSHCNYTEMLYNGGIIMFLVYYWIYYKIISDFFKKKKSPEKYRAFAIATAISFLLLDYGAITYTAAIVHIMLALSLKLMDFDCVEENILSNNK